MNKSTILPRSLLALAALALVVSAVQRPPVKAEPSIGTITTLYANDPLETSLDFHTGQFGMVVQGGQIFNRDSHICMGYFPDSLAVAIQGGDSGAIVDLGTLPETGKALGTPFVGNSGNVYLALQSEWVRAHAGLQQLTTTAHAPIKIGHLYLVRIASEGSPDLFAKLVVLDFQSGAKVTFRWQLLDG